MNRNLLKEFGGLTSSMTRYRSTIKSANRCVNFKK